MIDFASKSTRLKFSNELMSGLGAPVRTATPVADLTRPVFDFGSNLSAVDQRIENGRWNGNQIESLSRIDPSDKLRAQAGRDIELMPRVLFKFRTDFFQNRATALDVKIFNSSE